MSLKENYLSITGEAEKFAIVGDEIQRPTIESLLEGNIPDLFDALKIAKALGVSVEDLVLGEDEDIPAVPGPTPETEYNSPEEVLRSEIINRMVKIAGYETNEELATKGLKIDLQQITNFIRLNTRMFYPHIVDFAIKHNKSLDELFGKSHTEFALKPPSNYLSLKEQGYISMVHRIYAKGKECTIKALEKNIEEFYRLMKLDPRQTD